MRNSPYLPIADYGIIGNLRTAALVGRSGSIDWCCFPSLDSPSVFGALLDHRKGGRFRVAPGDVQAQEQRYLEGTNVLETVFHGEQGRLSVIDFMPLAATIRGRGLESAPSIHRILWCPEGEVEVRLEWSPRFDYARAITRLAAVDGGFMAVAGPERMGLAGVPREHAEIVEDEFGPVLRARFRLRGGERLALVARYGAAPAHYGLADSLRAFRATVHAWRGWVHVCEPPGDCAFAGPLHRRVVRSGLALKLLTHPHTGAIAAAATTSLPEKIGGVRNWDYRFTWLRDASLVSQALFALGYGTEARDFLYWVEEVSRAADQSGYELQIMYGLHGERKLPEIELRHLEGYRESRPVRIGNAAAEQLQLDIYGELIGAAYELVRMGGRIEPELWSFLAAMADQACALWRQPDHGIWEVRSEPRHFVFSKVMVWLALDRAIRLAERHRLPGRIRHWRREREAIRQAVLAEGFDPQLGAFVRSFGSKNLDAANLLLPIVEFLPAHDPRVQGTIDRTIEHLMENGMVRRYRADDGLPPGEGTFGLCTFWLVDALTLSGRLEEAREVFYPMAERSNHLGLYSEEISSRTGEFLGNFPQAFSQAGFINSALYLALAEGRRAPAPPPMGSREHRAEAGHRPDAAA